MNDEKAQTALRQEMELYSKLKHLSKTPDFEEYLNYLATNTVNQMLANYMGAEMPTHEKFMSNWSDVRGKLFVLQEVGGADLIEEQLLAQLKRYIHPES